MVQANGPQEQPGYGLAPGAPALPGGVPSNGPAVPGYPPAGAGGFGPGGPGPGAVGPGFGGAPGGYGFPQQPAPRGPLPLTRIGAGVAAAAGVVVLFGSLLNLYSVTIDPSAVPDADVTGTVQIGIGFYDVLPLAAPLVAVAIPVLMLVSALTSLPGILGRGPQGALVSAVSAIGATLLALVLMIANPLPSVELTGTLATDFRKDAGFASVVELVGKVVDVGPGAGLILALIVGLLGSAGAVLNFLQPGAPKTVPLPPAPAGPVGPPVAPFPTGQFAAPPVAPYATGQFPAIPADPTVQYAPGAPAPTAPGEQPGQAPQSGNPTGSW